MRYFIYFLYNADGRVDAYVPHFLNAIREQYDVIHVVFNGTLKDGEAARLSMADKVQERPNDEFDVGAYKAAIFSNPDSFYADECDEVTLANFTFFAPIGSMQPYYDWVDQNRDKMDFWGLSAHKKMVPNPFTGTGELPYHIQSHWITVGKDILKSGAFIDYWRNLAPIESYMDSVLKHESQFTRHFADQGYSYKLFFDDEPFESDYPAFNNIDEAIKAGLPILKRRLFYHTPTLYFDNYDVNLRRALEDCDNRGLFDSEMIWDSIKGTDPGTLYQTADNLRIVPDASLFTMPESMSARAEAIMVLQGDATPDEVRALFDRISAPLDLTLIAQASLANEIATAAKTNEHLASFNHVPMNDLGEGMALLRAHAHSLGDGAPVLFAMVSPDGLGQFDYGMRHLAGDPVVMSFARAEIEKSAFFGLGLPATRTYGAPAELDEVSDQMRIELREDLSSMPLDSQFKSFFLYSSAAVFWMRPSLLERMADVILTHAIEDDAGFEDLGSDQLDSTVLDSKKIDSLLMAGLPYLAKEHGLITQVISNTKELPRNFVKAEQRLRLVSERLEVKNPFALDQQMDYLSQYLSQEDRSMIFGQVHDDAFNEGWSKASSTIWEKAFLAGRAEGRKGKLPDLPEASGLVPAKIRDEIFNAGFEKGWKQSGEEKTGRIEELTKTAWQQGWDAARENAATGEQDRFDAVFKKGYSEGWEAAQANTSQGEQDRFEAVFKKGYSEGWEAAQANTSQSEKDRFEAVFKKGYSEGWEAAQANTSQSEKDRFDEIFKQGYEQGWEAAAKNVGGKAKLRGMFNQKSDK